MTNIVMIGVLCASRSLHFSEEVIVEVLRQTIKPAFYKTNMKALKLGKKAFRNAVKGSSKFWRLLQIIAF